jgi:hypothetical protein
MMNANSRQRMCMYCLYYLRQNMIANEYVNRASVKKIARNLSLDLALLLKS